VFHTIAAVRLNPSRLFAASERFFYTINVSTLFARVDLSLTMPNITPQQRNDREKMPPAP